MGEVILVTNGTENTIATCKSNEIFNITSLACQEVWCPSGKELVDGYCQDGDVSSSTLDQFIIIAYASSPISIIGSIALVLTYSLFKELRNLPGKVVMSLSIAFLLSDVFITCSTGFIVVESKGLCDFISISLHYLALCQFLWTNIVGIEYIRTFRLAIKVQMGLLEKQKLYLFVVYSMLGWGIPGVIVLVAVIINYTALDGAIYYGAEFCWISRSYIAVFFIPLFISSVFNMVIFGVVICMLCKVRSSAIGVEHSSLKQVKRKRWVQLRAMVALFAALNVTWVTAFGALFEGGLAWVFYFVLNCTRSYIVAVAFLFSKRVGHLYRTLITQCYRRLVAFCSGAN